MNRFSRWQHLPRGRAYVAKIKNYNSENFNQIAPLFIGCVPMFLAAWNKDNDDDDDDGDDEMILQSFAIR